MQFKIPQDVQREDKIVGPLTLRQLIICGIGFSIAYGFYTIIGRSYIWFTALIPAIFIALITMTFAFIKPLDIVFEKYILFALEFFFILPRKRYWLKGTGDPQTTTYIPAAKKEVKKGPEPATSAANKPKTVQELSKILDNPNFK